jgi:hypothetical protein
MKNKETRQKRGIVPLLSAVAAVLGIATASFVFVAVGGNAETVKTTQSPAISVPSETNTTTTETPSATPSETPSTEPVVSGGDTSSTGSGTTGTKPSTGGSNSNGSTGSTGNGSTGGGTKPKPAPTSCPLSRSDDPATWDACRAGYVAPKIEFAGLVSCTPANDAKTNWNLTYAFRLSGGNFKGVDWSNSNGKTTILVKGYPIDGPGDTYPLIASVDVAMLPMNGLSGLIDMLSFSRTIDVPTGQFCK